MVVSCDVTVCSVQNILFVAIRVGFGNFSELLFYDYLCLPDVKRDNRACINFI